MKIINEELAKTEKFLKSNKMGTKNLAKLQ